MFSKISVLSIVKDHIRTLVNNRTGKISYGDIFLFFLIPAVISVALVHKDILLNDGLVNALITSFSIFSALLFNLLLLVYDIAGKSAEQNNQSKLTDPVEIRKVTQRRELLREIYINVSFSILISTIIVVVLLTYFLKPNNCNIWAINICSLQWLLALVIYYFSSQFLLTLFMVLKRIYLLLARAFDSL